ncbi:hypothetical protein BaRGS_00003563 [Batillaria attramentaria]|uniref:Uncharacterized protein n=1 Tax=Batillaria attramentaria TaxID=370345 RepID=A0ABD0M1L7_9CAEN
MQLHAECRMSSAFEWTHDRFGSLSSVILNNQPYVPPSATRSPYGCPEGHPILALTLREERRHLVSRSQCHCQDMPWAPNCRS